MTIDLNSDLGEGFGPWTMGDDDAMLAVVTSANVACGGHASDPETMYLTLKRAAERGVVIGAHPGYADREGFGRRVIPMKPAEIGRMFAAQVGSLQAIAALAGADVRYVKPHGALGNQAADDRATADAIVAATRALPGDLAVLAISGTELEVSARAAGVEVFSEIFADRTYLSNGRLVPRSRAGSVLHNADEAADRLIRFIESGKMPTIDGDVIELAAHSICVHGDSAGAVDMAKRLRSRLAATGISVSPFLKA
ncbi:LamB/YcsF family protein [Ensifer sp. ENS05]|uniref:LamB/YcsF family protein n=1 Tax=Ensifer sp. ENS05 TaxID=2769277 RepID=UPI00177E2F8F|nr:5-oxoprolinase subunit PxpA [Ensifer sp. ENS05]MBD9597736.1 LamB/YcsF family protein [Ensifer sp. ENS05]